MNSDNIFTVLNLFNLFNLNFKITVNTDKLFTIHNNTSDYIYVNSNLQPDFIFSDSNEFNIFELYDINDINELFSLIEQHVTQNKKCIIKFPFILPILFNDDLLSLVDGPSQYFLFTTIQNLCNQYNLKIVDTFIDNQTTGYCLIGQQDNTIQHSIIEFERNIDEIYLSYWAGRIVHKIKKINQYLSKLNGDKTIALYGNYLRTTFMNKILSSNIKVIDNNRIDESYDYVILLDNENDLIRNHITKYIKLIPDITIKL